jgi:predicted DNA-binding transcriptional regulator AlpA
MSEQKSQRSRRVVPEGALRETLRTREAADFLGVSVPTMKKWRNKAPGDPGEKGPQFIRISDFLVIYEVSALRAWINAHKSHINHEPEAA